MKRLSSLISLVVLFLLPAAALAQSPGWSRGQQLLTITYEDCVRRASQVLQAEGYNVEHAAGNFAVGRRDVHTSVIICNPVADGKQVVNIVVASNGEGGGTQRERLQARMEGSIPSRDTTTTGGPTTPTGAVAATWYMDASAHLKSPDGTRISYACPPFPGEYKSMWGTDVYTFDSGICMSGVHSGVITKERGGIVTIEMRAGQDAYPATSRNGISSQGYGPYNKSFAVIRGGANAVVPQANRRTGVTGFIGCFKDTSAFDLDGHLERTRQNTPARCVEVCRQKGFAFAAVQFGESCLCGNSYGRYGRAENCNMPCTGDSNQTCGGHSANSVYGTGVAPP